MTSFSLALVSCTPFLNVLNSLSVSLFFYLFPRFRLASSFRLSFVQSSDKIWMTMSNSWIISLSSWKRRLTMSSPKGFGPQHDTWEPQSQLLRDHGGRVAVALYRARRSAVDAHGSYARRRAPHGRTDPLPPLSPAQAQEVAASLTQW